jgi:rapamycin-insensitive companion of mTOR
MQILEAHHFRLPACRFVLDLFDKAVLPQIVLEEEEQSEESTDSDSDSDTAAVGANGVAKIP